MAHSASGGAAQAVAVRVTPRSSCNQVLGLRDGVVAIKLKAPPVDGAANAALLAYVAELAGVPRRDVRLVRGQSSRSKWIAVAGLEAAVLQERLLTAGPPHPQIGGAERETFPTNVPDSPHGVTKSG